MAAFYLKYFTNCTWIDFWDDEEKMGRTKEDSHISHLLSTIFAPVKDDPIYDYINVRMFFIYLQCSWVCFQQAKYHVNAIKKYDTLGMMPFLRVRAKCYFASCTGITVFSPLFFYLKDDKCQRIVVFTLHPNVFMLKPLVFTNQWCGIRNAYHYIYT